MTDKTDALVALADRIEFSGSLEYYEKVDIATAIRALAAPAEGGQGECWQCFHCEEVFTDRDSAALHFGASEREQPACQIDIAEYRRMEALEARYAEEDSDVHRAMRRQQGERQQAVRRAEEEGYARGLRDSGKCPCATPPAASVDVEGLREGLKKIAAEPHDPPYNSAQARQLERTKAEAVRLLALIDSAGGADMARKREGYRVLAESTPQPDGGDGAVACIDHRHLQLLRKNWTQGNCLKHPDDAIEGDVKLYTRPSAAAVDEAALREAAEYAQHCLQRGLEIDWQECTCEGCPECGKQPNECSGTECAQTCQCSMCDHCCATDAVESLTAALAAPRAEQEKHS